MRARVRALLFVACVAAGPLAAAQAPPDPGAALRSHAAMLALDRYLETWNSRNGALWATSLHYPHVRPGAGAFEVSETAEQYAAGVDFAQTVRTGWDHTEWVSREVLHVGIDKVHVAGTWQRYTAEGRPQATSAITYIVTEANGHWGVQARFAAGAGVLDSQAVARSAEAGRAALAAFFDAWNAHDPAALARAIHYPHVRIGDRRVEVWPSPERFLDGPEPGRQRTWYQTRVDEVKAVQATANGVNLSVRTTRLGRDGGVLSIDEGVYLAVLRDGLWKIQARSMMGT